MSKRFKNKEKSVQLLCDVHPNILKHLEECGLLRCHNAQMDPRTGQIVSWCAGVPVVDVKRPGPDGKPMHSIFCRECGEKWCIDCGLSIPTAGKN